MVDTLSFKGLDGGENAVRDDDGIWWESGLLFFESDVIIIMYDRKGELIAPTNCDTWTQQDKTRMRRMN